MFQIFHKFFIRRLCYEIFQVNKNSQQSPHSEAHRSLRYCCWPVGPVQQLLQYFLKVGHKVQMVVIKYGMETQQWGWEKAASVFSWLLRVIFKPSVT